MRQSDKNPKVSVIIRCFNQAEFIEHAIISVLAQAYQNLEIIVIDDCSTDNSQKIISELAQQDKRIEPMFNRINLGRGTGSAKVLNVALANCTGQYVAILDGDDFWLVKDKIKKQVAWLETHPDYVLVGSFVCNVNTAGAKLDKFYLAVSDKSIRERLLVKNQIAASSVLLRLKAVQEAGGYPEKQKSSVDLGLWLKLGQQGKFYNFPLFWQAHRMTGVNLGETKRRQQLKDALFYIKENRDYYPHYYQAWWLHQLQILAFSLPQPAINLIRWLKAKITIL